MKFRFEMKGRSALRAAIDEAVVEQCAVLGLASDEQAVVVKQRAKKALDACSLWFVDGSTATLEVDMDAGTCVVVAA